MSDVEVQDACLRWVEFFVTLPEDVRDYCRQLDAAQQGRGAGDKITRACTQFCSSSPEHSLWL
eukprot:6248208-Amphidinium_carterae.1